MKVDGCIAKSELGNECKQADEAHDDCEPAAFAGASAR